MQSTLKVKGLLVITLLPALLLYSFFVIVPIFWSAYYGFFKWSGIGEATYIGFQNYVEIIQDSVFWRALKNNMIIVAASIIGQVPIALGLALLLRKSNLFQRFVRSAIFLPMVISTVVVGLIWGYIYDSQIGVVNAVLTAVGLESVDKSLVSGSICEHVCSFYTDYLELHWTLFDYFYRGYTEHSI